MAAVYRIRNVVNGKVYVGSHAGADARRRWASHQRELRRGVHHSPHLQRAWAKYGAEAFAFEVLEDGIIPECVVAREQAWLDKLRPFGTRGYNVCPTAGSCLGAKHTPEARANMSEAQRGRNCTPETRARIAESNRRRFASPEARAKIAAANRGRKHTAESRAKMSEAQRGRNCTPEARAKISKSLRVRFGSDASPAARVPTDRPHTAEHRDRIRAGLLRAAEQRRAQSLAK